MDHLEPRISLDPQALPLTEEQNPLFPDSHEEMGTYRDPLLRAGAELVQPWDGGETPFISTASSVGVLIPATESATPVNLNETLAQIIIPEPETDFEPTPQSLAARAWLETLLNQDAIAPPVSAPTLVTIPADLDQMTAAFLGEALNLVTQQLTAFESQPDFVSQLETAFGAAWPSQTAETLLEQWLNGSDRPTLEILSQAEIGGRGAYAQSSNTIYLAQEVVNHAPATEVAALYLEELGHAFDAQLNSSDSPGDEGAIFAAIVQGRELSSEQLDHWRAEDDHALQTMGGGAVSLEYNGPPGISEGYFTVESSGQVTVDYLYDGNVPQGEIGIFSLAGMDLPQLGTLSFTREALSRALTGTTEGHIVISDTQEGAKVEGPFNRGDYQGPRTVAMTPGDHFGVIVVPYFTIQQAKDWWVTNPYISLVPSNDSNPGAYQMRSVQNAQNVFAVEDQALPSGNQDYKDYIFSIEGAIATVGLVDPHINSANDWRNTALGDVILPQPSTPDSQNPYISIRLAQDNGSNPFDGISNNGSLSGQVLDPSGIASVRTRIVGGTYTYTDITGQLNSDGRFNLDEQQLTTIKGSALNEGVNVIEVEATDNAGNLDRYYYGYQRDTTLNLSWGLDATSDSGPVGDLTTDQDIVTLTGQADPNSSITLTSTGQTTTADGAGNFSVTNVALERGANSFAILATDAAGNETTLEQTITRADADSAPPYITLALTTDSGSDASDSITNNPAINGQVSDNNGVSQLQARLNNGSYTDITTQLNADGTYVLDAGLLSSLNGGSLPDGNYTLELQATDGLGNSDSQTLNFTLDTIVNLTWGLDTASDSGVAGDRTTDQRTVTLTGQTEPNSSITLTVSGTSFTAIADAAGNFSFTDVDLSLGDNAIDIAVTDTAGNVLNQSQTFTREWSAAPPAGISEGYFTVDTTGQVVVDYLYDGNFATGEIGIFSLSGMDLASLGTLAFTQEALRRTLTGTSEGHRIINDTQQGAKIDGLLNAGSYQGPQTVQMTPGDQFGVIVVPQFTLQQAKDWQLTDPYISLVPSDDSNPGAYQLRAIQNAQNVFALEDAALSSGDRDYNDLLFSLEGVVANVGLLDPHIDPAQGWRDSSFGDIVLPQPSAPDSNNPYVFVKLTQDNGNNPYDRLSNNGSISGQILDPSGIASVRTRVIGGTYTYTDITSQINADGTFSLDEQQLVAIKESALNEGTNVVEIEATDSLGNVERYYYGYQIDTTLNLSWGLDAASDTDLLGDLQTEAATVNLIGQADPNSNITLTETGATTTADAQGNFTFAGITLSLGDNSFEIAATDAAGNQTSVNQTVTRFDPNTTAPALAVGLVTDSGNSATDGITNAPAITGQVSDSNGVSQLQAKLNGGSYLDITSQLNADGTYTLDAGFLTSLNGGGFPDGDYTVEVQATDNLGNSESQALNFTLDTAVNLTWDLDTTSDSDPVGDRTTIESTVTLTGQTDPGSTVTLNTTGATAIADANGNFSFTDVALEIGANAIDIAVTDTAGNQASLSQTLTRELSTVLPSGLNGGYFKVDVSGEVTIDYLYDGGSYESELGIFSLSGMEAYELGSDAFVQEAIRRVLTDSVLGRVLIKDHQEGARDAGGFNVDIDQYQGAKTVTMTPGDHFALIVTHGWNPTFEQAQSGFSATPHISLVSSDGSNPSANQFQQVPGQENVFMLEDILLSSPESDHDFDDMTFSLTGATLGNPSDDSDVTAPLISLGLTNDTGSNDSDQITNNPEVSGQVTDATGVSQFTVSLNGSDPVTEITSQLNADGTFTLTETLLTTLNGGTLPDGDYTVELTATDPAGNTSTQSLDFTLDTSLNLNWGLDPASDTAPLGDLQTEQSLVTLTGTTDPDSTVTLTLPDGSDMTTTANDQGDFRRFTEKKRPAKEER